MERLLRPYGALPLRNRLPDLCADLRACHPSGGTNVVGERYAPIPIVDYDWVRETKVCAGPRQRGESLVSSQYLQPTGSGAARQVQYLQ